MATADPIPDITTPSASNDNGLLVLLAAMTPEQLDRVLAKLTASFPAEDLLIASPDAASDALLADSYPSLRIVAAPAANASWTLTAADFVSAYQLASKDKRARHPHVEPGVRLAQLVRNQRTRQRRSHYPHRPGSRQLRFAAERRPGQLRNPLSAYPRAVRLPRAISPRRRSRPLASHGRTPRRHCPAFHQAQPGRDALFGQSTKPQ